MKIPLSIIIVFTLLINVSCTMKEENTDSSFQQKTTDQVYTTVQAETVNYANEISAIGILSNKNEYKLSFMVSGIVNYLKVNEGDYVKKGQVLARIDQTTVEVMTKQLTLAYEKEQRDFKRVEALYTDGVVTLEDFQNAKTGLENTKLELESAKFNKKHATIIAPGSGKIQSILAHENEMTSAGSPVIILGSNKGGKVLEASIADVDIVKVKMKDPCTIRFDAFPNRTFTGYVSEISGIADRYTGTYAIEIFVNDTDNILKSGFIGKAKIKSRQEIKYIQIPIESLITANKMTGEINVLVNGKKKSKTIKIAKILNENLLVSDGLSENEEVIIN